ncbi:MAG: hypothetical protein K0R93_2303 [Anaerosolibacter sp.]|jgi:hypothetical protein|nr:hypothetical protein [Anaerosolibacter sp.]
MSVVLYVFVFYWKKVRIKVKSTRRNQRRKEEINIGLKSYFFLDEKHRENQ